MIPNTLNEWYARGCTILVDKDAAEGENVAVALGIADEIKGWDNNIVPTLYVPDGVTECPANVHNRVVMVLYRYGPIRHVRLGHIILENGKARVGVNRCLVDEHCDEASVDDFGPFDLSDPEFPETVLRQFECHIEKPRKTPWKTENSPTKSRRF